MSFGKGRLFLAIAFILAGSSVVAARYVSGSLHPYIITFMSLVFASLTAFLFFGKSIFGTIKKLSKRLWKILVLQSVFGIFLFRVFLTFGLRYTSAAEAGIITGTTSAITAIFTRLLLKERFNKNSITGILFTFSGVLMLQGFPFNTGAFNISHLSGNMLALGAASCESLFTALSRKTHTDRTEDYELHPFVQSGIVSLIALILCFVPMLPENQFSELTGLPISGWIALIWYGSIVTVIAFACMFTGAKYCDGYTIAAFTGLMPISALILSLIILKETVDQNQVIGCGFIVISIIIMSRKYSAIRNPAGRRRP
jgi:drug/metabolite transporter (DMT)-like permease